MKWLIKIFPSFIILALSNYLNAQSTHGIKLIAKPTSDSIILRWAPTSALAWTLLNKYGYQIERFTIVRDTMVLENKIHNQLTTSPILPAPRSAWLNQFEKDDYVAIAAQAIFGESFDLIKKENTDLSMITKVREMESRYTFSLYAADLSPGAAKLSGLQFVDKDVKGNEKYLYKIHSLVPNNIININSGLCFIGFNDSRSLSKPKKPELQFGNKSVLVSWGLVSTRNIYTAFIVEKSINGRNFFRINKQPVSAFGSQDFAVLSDTLRSNDQLTYYRIIGLTPFGESGPPSESSSGMGIDELNHQAVIIGSQVISNTVQLLWKFNQEKEILINGFEIERSPTSDRGYSKIGKLSPTFREFIDPKPEGTNYYRIISLAKNGGSKTSLPVLVQLLDSIPPAPPIGLAANIDTAGIVTLAWNKNTELDLLGYRIYKSNFKNSEFSLLNDSVTSENHYQEKINLRTLSSKVYYKVLALDKRYNPSEPSSIITIELPDIIPPVSPILTKIKSQENKIIINWINSSSDDVVMHQLLKKGKNVAEWEVIQEFNNEDSTIFEFYPNSNEEFQYCLTAADRHGLKSPHSNVLTKAVKRKYLPIEKLESKIDRIEKTVSLNWNYDSYGVSKFLIYRAFNDEPVTWYKSILANAETFVDENLISNSTYKYRVKVIFKDGGESPFSKELIVNY